MSRLLYGRKALGGRLRVGVAAILSGQSFIRLLSVLIVSGFILWVIGFAHGRERSPCLVFGQPLPCQNFISSDPAQNKIRDEDLARRIQRDRKHAQLMLLGIFDQSFQDAAEQHPQSLPETLKEILEIKLRARILFQAVT